MRGSREWDRRRETTIGRWVGVMLLLIAGGCRSEVSRAASPGAALAQLLRQDSAFGAASARTDLLEAISPIFATEVMTPDPEAGWRAGREHAIAALSRPPVRGVGRLTWAPIRGGVSGDGRHGFTFGYMSHQVDGDSVPLKYLAYWVRGADGWRLLTWKRVPRGVAPIEPLPGGGFLPEAFAGGDGDPTRSAEQVESLRLAEQAFSDEAQVIGLGRAFARWGRSDAINLGGPGSASFVYGATAIGLHVSGGDTLGASPVAWSAERVVVAPSGDLGVTFGRIRPHDSTRGPIPFFTVWARTSADGAWRYIAE